MHNLTFGQSPVVDRPMSKPRLGLCPGLTSVFSFPPKEERSLCADTGRWGALAGKALTSFEAFSQGAKVNLSVIRRLC